MVTQRTVTYQVDADRHRRLTIARCSSLAAARYNVYLREGREWLVAQGIVVGNEFPESGDVERQLLSIDRAQCLASLAKVEESADGQDFAQVEIPEAWLSVEPFLEDVPGVVLDAWARVAREVNPGLFPDFSSEAEKNAVAVIVE